MSASRMSSVNATSFGSGIPADQMSFGRADPAGFQAKKVDLSALEGIGGALGEVLSSLAKLGSGSGGAKSSGASETKGTSSQANNIAKMSTSLPGSAAQQFAATKSASAADRAAEQGQGKFDAVAKVDQGGPQLAQAEQSQEAAQATDKAVDLLKEADEQAQLAQNNSQDPLSLFGAQEEIPPPPPPEPEEDYGAEEAVA